MSYSISTLKADLAATLHGTTLNQIQNLNGLINRAARQLILDVDPQETKRTVPIMNSLFYAVYNYQIPVDTKGDRIINIFPQVGLTYLDAYRQLYNRDFNFSTIQPTTPDFTIQFNEGIKSIRINSPYLNPGTSINPLNTLNTQGTWSITNATNLVQDPIYKVDPNASLAFTVGTGAQNPTIYDSIPFPALNITSYVNVGTIFLWVYIPTNSVTCTSVPLRFGSDASDYITGTATMQADGTAFQNGWNQVSYNLNSMTTVGSPNFTAMNYLNIGFTQTTSTQPQVYRVNLCTLRLGYIFNIEYYSKYLFRDATTGAFQETVTSDTNLINLDTESYNLLFYQVGLLAVQQQQGLDASFFDSNFFGQKYSDDLARYKQLYKSEVQKPQTTYYGVKRSGYRKFFNRRNF